MRFQIYEFDTPQEILGTAAFISLIDHRLFFSITTWPRYLLKAESRQMVPFRSLNWTCLIRVRFCGVRSPFAYFKAFLALVISLFLLGLLCLVGV